MSADESRQDEGGTAQGRHGGREAADERRAGSGADALRGEPLAVRERTQDLDRRERREGRYRRAVLAGLAASVLIHAAVILGITRELPVPVAERDAPEAELLVPPEGLEVVQLEPTLPSPPEPLPDDPDVEPEEEPPAEAEAPVDPGEAVPVPVEGEEALTNAERLRPREGDGRLWERFATGDLPEADRPLTFRADSAIRVVLRDWLDSLRLEEEAYRAARDWTFGEGDKRFGISSEGLHLGDITIPLPLGELLQPPGPLRRQIEREMRELEAIQRQEQLGDAEAVREERIQAMRERSRQEAESRRAESESDPDTTANDDSDP